MVIIINQSASVDSSHSGFATYSAASRWIIYGLSFFSLRRSLVHRCSLIHGIDFVSFIVRLLLSRSEFALFLQTRPEGSRHAGSFIRLTAFLHYLSPTFESPRRADF